MSDFKVSYKGDLSTEITHLSSGSKVLTDLVASSLASCMLTIIAIAANTHKINIKSMEADVIKVMSKTVPRRISQIGIKMIITGIFNDKSKKIIERSAKNCPVHHSLNKEMIINLDIQYK